jgi:uncharacterized protein
MASIFFRNLRTMPLPSAAYPQPGSSHPTVAQRTLKQKLQIHIQWTQDGEKGGNMSSQPKNVPALVPPFTRETAILKVRAVEDNWNTRDPQRVARGYSVDCYWRNRSEFLHGREEVIAFLTRKWAAELDYRLIKELWAFGGNRIAVRFAYESHDPSGQWFRSYGNENWEFDDAGLSRIRHASINDLAIKEEDRLYRWPLGRRPDDHPSLTDLGL